MYKHFLKTIIDFVVSLLGIVALSPLILLFTILLFFINKGKPFFIQSRPGKQGIIFKVIKFKTMNEKRDKNGKLLSDSERLTPLGRFIRKTSLDELPQLFCVLKGDMSLVGPRPLLVEYLPLYSKEQARRHEVRPGITGWAQVNGRNSISWEEKFKLDVWYVDNFSFFLDIKILFISVLNVLKSKDIIKEGFATTEAFNGKN
jgi:lipopolysaccharide/colanic/teichoic acid biosynthesis glycosyltransferase